jgi:hypothetical protein
MATRLSALMDGRAEHQHDDDHTRGKRCRPRAVRVFRLKYADASHVLPASGWRETQAEAAAPVPLYPYTPNDTDNDHGTMP